MTEPSEPAPRPSSASFAPPPEASVVSEHNTFAAPPPMPARTMPIALGVIVFIMLLSVVASYAGGSLWGGTLELLLTLGLASGSNWARRFIRGVLILQIAFVGFVLAFGGRGLEPWAWWAAATVMVLDAIVIAALQRADVQAYFAPIGASKPAD